MLKDNYVFYSYTFLYLPEYVEVVIKCLEHSVINLKKRTDIECYIIHTLYLMLIVVNYY